MRIIKRINIFISVIIFSAQLIGAATTATIGNLKYSLDASTKTAVVLGTKTSMLAINNLTIPSTVEYSGNTYSVTRINSSAFDGNTNLTGTLTVSEGIYRIDTQAFRRCAFTTIKLPSTLRSVGLYAFQLYYGIINSVECRAVNPPSYDPGYPTIFEESLKLNTPLKVPAGSIEKYRDSYAWNFSKISALTIVAESIVLNYDEVVLKPNETIQILATVLPEDAEDKTVTWTSSDNGVVTVNDEGIIMTIKDGTAIIKATCGNVSAQCTVIVDQLTDIAEIHLDEDKPVNVYSISGIFVAHGCMSGILKELNQGNYIVVANDGSKRIKVLIK